jgi:hypothetical protein
MFVAQNMKIKGDHKFSASKGTTGVAALTLVHHADDVATYLAGDTFEFLDIRHDREVGLKLNLKEEGNL